jgi:dimethylamine monooxygenase subunit A
MDEIILQDRLPDAPWSDASFRRLPGMRPVGGDDWILVDEVYSRQMAMRERFLDARRDAVLALLPEAREAAEEVLEITLGTLARRPDFGVTAAAVRRPDGVEVRVARDDPLGTVGRLLQEDVCLLEKRGEEHVLTGAVLVFPSGWTLAQKIGRPLLRIHLPVAAYDDDIGRRVQRLFEGLQPGRPLMRGNLLWHGAATLHQPRLEGEPKPHGAAGALFLRSERQCLVRLPRTGAVIFTIHTSVVDAAGLSPEDRAALGHRPA